jgi:hypothetical protein
MNVGVKLAPTAGKLERWGDMKRFVPKILNIIIHVLNAKKQLVIGLIKFVASVFSSGKEREVVLVFEIVIIIKKRVIITISTIIVQYAKMFILGSLFVKNVLKNKWVPINKLLFSRRFYPLQLLV